MSVTSGFYPIISGVEDVLYDSEHVGKVYHGLYLNGVLKDFGDFFTCQIIDFRNVKIGSGLAYLNGYYVYSDADINYTISDDLYPTPEPTVTSIFVSELPQADYPSGNALDLGDIQVTGVVEESSYTIIGSVYIVIRLDLIGRKFDIKAIRPSEYVSNTDLLLAIFTRNGEDVSIKNMVGYYGSGLYGPELITGVNQKTYLKELIDEINYAYYLFDETWVNVKKDYFNAFFSDVRYYLDTPYQFDRLMSLTGTKANKIMTFHGTILQNWTYISWTYPGIPENRVISVRPKYLDVMITDAYVQGTEIIVRFPPADKEYEIFVDVFDIGELVNG